MAVDLDKMLKYRPVRGRGFRGVRGGCALKKFFNFLTFYFFTFFTFFVFYLFRLKNNHFYDCANSHKLAQIHTKMSIHTFVPAISTWYLFMFWSKLVNLYTCKSFCPNS